MFSRGTCTGFHSAGSPNKVLMLDDNEKAPVPEEVRKLTATKAHPIPTLTDRQSPDRDGIYPRDASASNWFTP